MNIDIITRIKSELREADKPENKLDYQRFFKEKLKERYGLKTSILRSISNKCFRDVRNLAKDEILAICDQLLESDFRYSGFFAFEWAGKISERFEKSDFKRFERWVGDYVDSWATCDHLCGSVIGQLVTKFPELSAKVIKWSKSENMWFRRASAVSLIVPVRNKMLLDMVFKTADILLMDEEDLVQKGYGWMLKVAGDSYPDEVFAYVMKHKDKMPRTALRYAIEKYPQHKRKEAMS